MWEFWRSKSKGSASRNGRPRGVLSPDREGGVSDDVSFDDGRPGTAGGSPPSSEKSGSPRRRGPTSPPEQTHIYFKDLKLPVEDPDEVRDRAADRLPTQPVAF
jgi:hypothetical protein